MGQTAQVPFKWSLSGVEVFEKADADGKKRLGIRGFATTDRRDWEGEAVVQDALDFRYLLGKDGDGGFRWKHTPKDQAQDRPAFSKVGKVLRVQKGVKTPSGSVGTYVEGLLYDDETGREIYQKGLAMQAVGDSLGLSVEGSVVERSKADKRVLRAVVRNIAIDPHPVNPEARAEMFAALAKAVGAELPAGLAKGCKSYLAKGDDDEDGGGIAPETDDEGAEPFPETDDEDDAGGIAPDDEADKALATANLAPVTPQDIQGHRPQRRDSEGRKAMDAKDLDLIKGLSPEQIAALLTPEQRAALAERLAPETDALQKAQSALDRQTDELRKAFGDLDPTDVIGFGGDLRKAFDDSADAQARTANLLDGIGKYLPFLGDLVKAQTARIEALESAGKAKDEALQKAMGVVDHVARQLHIPLQPQGALSPDELSAAPAERGTELITRKEAGDRLSKARSVASARGQDEIASRIGDEILALYGNWPTDKPVPVDALNRALAGTGFQA